MKSYHDCVPCMFRQALHSVRMAVNDESVRGQVMREVTRAFRDMDMRQSPPVMGQRIHRIIRETTGNRDPYRQVKDRFNHLALELYPALKARVNRSAGSMETAIRLAIAGNIIDSGANSELDEDHVQATVESAFTEPLVGSMEELTDAASTAEKIL